MIKTFPKWFWITLLIFCICQWLALPIINYFTYSSRDVATGVFIIIFILYPLYFISITLLLKAKYKFIFEQLIVAWLFLLLPPMLYIPVFTQL